MMILPLFRAAKGVGNAVEKVDRSKDRAHRGCAVEATFERGGVNDAGLLRGDVTALQMAAVEMRRSHTRKASRDGPFC